MEKKQVINLIFLMCVLGSCHRSSSQWQLDRVSSGTYQHSSSKLVYASANPTHGIDLELLQTAESLHMYLNVHSVPLPEKGKRFLTIEGKTYPLEAHQRKGGQRLLLSDSTARLIIDSLLNEIPVQIHLPGYQTTLDPHGFAKQFEKMENLNPIRNPFHQPF